MKLIRNKYFILVGLSILYLAVRAGVTLCSERLIFQGEEPYIGIVARGIIEGWAKPLLDFQVCPHFGGSIINSILVVPFFVLIGQSYLSLRIVSILFHLTGLVFLFFLMARHFNVRSAFLSCLLYVFSPPLLTARSLIFNGSHAELVVWNIMIFYVFFNLIDRQSRKSNYIILGILSGFALGCCYSAIVTIFSYTFVWFLKNRRFFWSKGYFLYSISFILGLIPWLMFNLANNFAGWHFIKRNLEGSILTINPGEFVNTAKNLIFREAYKISSFDQFSLFTGAAFNIIFYLVFCLSFLFLMFKLTRWFFNRKKLEWDLCGSSDAVKIAGIIIFPITFVIVYALSSYRFGNAGDGIIDYRYALPIFPFIFMTIALFFDHLQAKNNKFLNNMSKALLILLILISIIGNGRFIYSLDLNNNFLNQSAYNYDLVGAVAFRRHDTDMSKVNSMLSEVSLQEKDIYKAYQGYGEALGKKYMGVENLEKYVNLAEDIPLEKNRNWFFRGIGRSLARVALDSGGGTARFKSIFSRCNKVVFDPVDKDHLFWGMLHNLATFNSDILPEIITLLPNKYYYCTVFLYGCAEDLPLYRKEPFFKELNFSKKFETKYSEYYYMGMGLSIVHFFSSDMAKSLAFVSKFNYEIREWLLRGVGLYFYLLNDLDRDKANACLLGEYEEHKEYFLKGMDIYDDKIGFPMAVEDCP